MIEQIAIRLGKEALVLVLLLSAPPLLCAMGTGLMIAVLQATTQVQEQTLTSVPKMFVVFIILALMGEWMMSTLVGYTSDIFALFPVFF
jgi:flagellar biosynthetic protein FliQ